MAILVYVPTNVQTQRERDREREPYWQRENIETTLLLPLLLVRIT